MAGEYIDRYENVLFVGNSGTGKNPLGLCAGLRRLHAGTKGAVLYHHGPGHRLTGGPGAEGNCSECSNNSNARIYWSWTFLGYVPFAKAGAELLFDVVSRAYERVSLIVTTNLPFENCTEVCGSERLTGVMLDRLTHRVHILEANGQSYRLRQAKRHLKTRKSSHETSEK